MDDDTVNRLSLARITGHGIAIVEVLVLAEIEVDGFPGFQAKAKVSAGINLFNVPELAIGHLSSLERGRELDSFVLGKLPLFPVIDIDALEPLGIVGNLLAVLTADGEEVFGSIDVYDGRIFTLFDSYPATASGVPNHIPRIVSVCPLPVRPRQFVPVYEDREGVVLAPNSALSLEAFVNVAVDCKATLVVRRDNQTGIGIFEILPCDRLEALLGVGDLMNALLLDQSLDRVIGISSRK
jgi:hypothetical protein